MDHSYCSESVARSKWYQKVVAMEKIITLPTFSSIRETLLCLVKVRCGMCFADSKPWINRFHTTRFSSKCPSYMCFSDEYEDEGKELLLRDMFVIENFLEDHEERSLFDEIEPYIKRLRYEFDHWDDAIHGYRETERKQWKPENEVILQRVRDIAFPPGTPQLSFVHVLDLAENGLIKPHIDSVRFCGNTIAGLSLLSDSVMRLVHEKDNNKIVDILLKRRSLYIMKGIARYDFTHQILGRENSKFRGVNIPRGRRLSVICRNEPEKSQ